MQMDLGFQKQKRSANIYYRPQIKLREGNVFTPVCQSVCSRILLECILVIFLWTQINICVNDIYFAFTF